jgi:hypothetical protein
MTILKKVIGIVLLLLGGLISFSTLINLLKEIIIMVQMKEELSAYHIGYTIGIIIGLVFVSVIAYYLIKLGLKLLERKKEKADTIDDIGKTE